MLGVSEAPGGRVPVGQGSPGPPRRRWRGPRPRRRGGPVRPSHVVPEPHGQRRPRPAARGRVPQSRSRSRARYGWLPGVRSSGRAPAVLPSRCRVPCPVDFSLVPLSPPRPRPQRRAGRSPVGGPVDPLPGVDPRDSRSALQPGRSGIPPSLGRKGRGIEPRPAEGPLSSQGSVDSRRAGPGRPSTALPPWPPHPPPARAGPLPRREAPGAEPSTVRAPRRDQEGGGAQVAGAGERRGISRRAACRRPGGETSRPRPPTQRTQPPPDRPAAIPHSRG